MKNRERDNLYAIPLIGSILCFITFFISDNPYGFPGSFLTSLIYNFMFIFSMTGFTLILLIISFMTVILELLCGCVMLYSAIKMMLGKTTLNQQKMKLMIFSWLVIGATLIISIMAPI